MKHSYAFSPAIRALCALVFSGSALAQTEVSAILAGHAYLPASTSVQAPKAAGQAVQGFSGIVSLGQNRFLVLTDNGFGNKINSQDALLMLHKVKADWSKGQVALEATTFLHDPDKKVPFFILNENTDSRYLTGSDFDPESIQIVGDEWWIGDEFGPYVLRVTPQGKVLGVIETVVAGKSYRSPDHYLIGRIPGNYPGDALFESGNGKPYTRILELDVASQKYKDRQWKYQFEAAGNIAADFQMLDTHTGLVIERDDPTEGAGPNCPDEARVDCFTRPAKFKRIYKIDMSQTDSEGFVKKVAYIDLTRINNPQGLAKLGPNEAVFALPHLGPEGLTVVDSQHIVVVNDSNFPFSSGRTIGQPDHNELTLLNIKALVEAK